MKTQPAKKPRLLPLRFSRLGSQDTRTRRLRAVTIASLAVVSALALAGVASATGVDVDSNGYYDAVVREYDASYATALNIGPQNVGARCDFFSDDSVSLLPKKMYVSIWVRPPRVWALPGSSQQRVAWRPLILNTNTGSWVNPTQPLNWDTVAPGQSTEFGGGGDQWAANVDFGSFGTANYWTGGVHITMAAGGNLPYVQVYWQNANGGWAAHYILRIHYIKSNGWIIPDAVC